MISPLYLITSTVNEAEFFVRLTQVLDAGAQLIQLRLPGLSEERYITLAESAIPLCRKAGARLLLNCDPAVAERLGADGVHLSSARLRNLTARPLAQWVAASCHNRDELAQACALGVDFAVLSPVLATASHPAVQPLGWEIFRQLVAQVTIPVYALGGMTPAYLPMARAHGAQGIAAIGAVWEANNIHEAIRLCYCQPHPYVNRT